MISSSYASKAISEYAQSDGVLKAFQCTNLLFSVNTIMHSIHKDTQTATRSLWFRRESMTSISNQENDLLCFITVSDSSLSPVAGRKYRFAACRSPEIFPGPYAGERSAARHDTWPKGETRRRAFVCAGDEKNSGILYRMSSAIVSILMLSLARNLLSHWSRKRNVQPCFQTDWLFIPVGAHQGYSYL